MINAKFKFYADNTLVYTLSSSLESATNQLQLKSTTWCASQGLSHWFRIVLKMIECVHVNTCFLLGFQKSTHWFSNQDIEGKTGFILLKHKLFIFYCKERNVFMFLSVSNDGLIADMHAASSSFRMLDSWYHAALWFASGFLHPLLCLVWESRLVFLLQQKDGTPVYLYL